MMEVKTAGVGLQASLGVVSESESSSSKDPHQAVNLNMMRSPDKGHNHQKLQALQRKTTQQKYLQQSTKR